MFTLLDVLVDGLWVFGLAALLATFSYMNWVRNRRDWTWRFTLSTPRLLTPLCLSLDLFCIGMAVNGRLSIPPAPLWESMAWSILVVLFTFFALAYWLAGARRGWDTPIEGGDR